MSMTCEMLILTGKIMGCINLKADCLFVFIIIIIIFWGDGAITITIHEYQHLKFVLIEVGR